MPLTSFASSAPKAGAAISASATASKVNRMRTAPCGQIAASVAPRNGIVTERPPLMMAATVTKFRTLRYVYLMFDALDLGPIDLVLGQHPRLFERGRTPLGPGGQRHHRIHIDA